MSPVTHFLAGWCLANSAKLDRRERLLVTMASVIPDVDGLGIVVDLLTQNSENPHYWWDKYHHILGHNIGFALFITFLSFALVKRRWITALLVFTSFHLHILGDLVGARGPEGYQWPIPYLYPFSNIWELTWSGQWVLNAWPNFVITGTALILTFVLAWKQGFSPLEMISDSADKVFVKTLRNRFGG